MACQQTQSYLANRLAENPRERSITLHLPDLGSSKRNGQVDALMQEFARRLIAILKAEK